MDVEREDRMWKIPVEINIFWDRDIWDGVEGQQLQAVLKMLLTNAITLPDGSVQSAQARLSTSALYVWGTRDSENFTGQKFDKLGVNEGHPFLSFGCTILCSGNYQEPPLAISFGDQPADVTLTSGVYMGLYRDFTFAQSTAGIGITLEGPTSGEKSITVANTGAAPFTLYPGPHTIPAGSPALDFRWNVATDRWDEGI